MNPFIEKIIPLILTFIAGIVFKHLKLLSKDDAPIFLRLVLTVTLPALTIQSLLKVKLEMNMLFLPLCAQLVVFMIYFVALNTGKALKLPKTTLGSFLVGSMIMNTGFSLPFFQAAFAEEGFARASLFDVGNSFLIFTFIYYNAIKYGDNGGNDKIQWSKFLKLPPLWGLLIGLSVKGFCWEVPDVARNFLSLVGNPTIPLIMLSLGLYFEPKLKMLDKALIAIFIRMVVGLGCGWILTMIFNLEGITRTVVIVSSATPIGFNTLIFANLEELDKEFAATIVSLSILIAMFWTPLLIHLLK